MNCCDDNGRCTCGQGEPARPVRSCDELGLCQGHIPRCTGCTTPFEQTVRGVLQEEGERPLSLAPGVLEGYRVPRFGTPSQRRELAARAGALASAVAVVHGRAGPGRPGGGGGVGEVFPMSAPTTSRVYRTTVHRQFPKAEKVKREERISDAAAAAWRFMRDEGGFYTAGELGTTLLPSLPPQRAAITAGQWLRALSNRKHIAANPMSRRAIAYGVTGRCFPIPGETLEPSTNATEGSPE